MTQNLGVCKYQRELEDLVEFQGTKVELESKHVSRERVSRQRVGRRKWFIPYGMLNAISRDIGKELIQQTAASWSRFNN